MTTTNIRWISWIVLFGAVALPEASFASNAMTVQGVMRDSGGNLVSSYSAVGGVKAVFHHATQCNSVVNGDANLRGCAPAGGAGSEVINPFSIAAGAFSVTLTPDSATLAKMASNPTGWSVKLRGVFAPGAPIGEFLIPLNSVPFAKSCELASAVTSAGATGDSIIAAINAGSVQIDAARLPSTIPGVTISGGQVSGAVANATSAVSFSGALAGDVTGTQGATVVTALRGQPISTTAPSSAGQVLQWDGAKWGPAAGGLQGTVGVANGGTGVTTLTGIVKGNGASAFSAAVSGTDYLEKSGTVSNGKLAMWNGSSQLVDGPAVDTANTGDALVKRDGSGNFSAGTISAALSGNASTATALAANGSNCAAGEFPLGVDASGNAESCTAALTSEADTLATVTGRGATASVAVTLGAGATIKGTTSNNTAAALNVTDSSSSSKLYVRNDGNVGIGTTTPGSNLHMKSSSGDVILTIDGAEDSVLAFQSSGANKAAIWSDDVSGNLNFDVASASRMTISPTGKVGVGTVSPEFMLSLDNDGGILAKGTYASGAALTATGDGSRLIWYPKKAAFRVGWASGNYWDDANIGVFSISLGDSTKATGNRNVAIGSGAWATGAGSFAFGYNARASGDGAIAVGSGASAAGVYSSALGNYTNVSGQYATAVGAYTTADSYYQTTVGTYNLPKGTEKPASWDPVDPVFVVGNGTGAGASRSTAMMILKNGNAGIGTMSPRAKLDVAGSVLGPDPYGVVNGTGATSGTPIDFSKGNLQQTSIACSGNTVYLTNLTPGGAYSLLIDAATQSGTCSFEGAGTISAANPALTFVFQGGVNPAPNADGRVIYSFMVFGTGTNTAKVYVSLVDNLK